MIVMMFIGMDVTPDIVHRMHIGLVTVFITSNHGGPHHTSHANCPCARASVHLNESGSRQPEIAGLQHPHPWHRLARDFLPAST
jgi:hypothetical protein